MTAGARGGEDVRLPFADRAEAGRLLARHLDRFRGANPLVLGIPRGAVPMAKIIAAALEGELDVVLVHKLGAPGHAEYAIGSVDESGHVYLTEEAKGLGIPPEVIEQERRSQLEALRRRRAMYTPARTPADPAGRTVIVVDDGIATGATFIAALRAVRARHPRRLVATAAVAPAQALQRLRSEADDVVLLATPQWFDAVGSFFLDFSQVSDDEVVRALESAARGRA